MYEEPTEKIIVARAYVYHGEWVADCPQSCGNVEFLYVPSRMNGPRDQRKGFFMCSYCGAQAGISWPRNEHEITQVLAVRPVLGSRNWYPQDHPVAVNFRLPHGQSIADLLAENEEHGVDSSSLRGM